jgi:hypothetical protein
MNNILNLTSPFLPIPLFPSPTGRGKEGWPEGRGDKVRSSYDSLYNPAPALTISKGSNGSPGTDHVK